MVTHELREGAVIACGHPRAMDSGGRRCSFAGARRS